MEKHLFDIARRNALLNGPAPRWALRPDEQAQALMHLRKERAHVEISARKHRYGGNLGQYVLDQRELQALGDLIDELDAASSDARREV